MIHRYVLLLRYIAKLIIPEKTLLLLLVGRYLIVYAFKRVPTEMPVALGLAAQDHHISLDLGRDRPRQALLGKQVLKGRGCKT